MAALITYVTFALFPHQDPTVSRQAFPTNEGYAEISTGESHAQPNRVLSNTAVISPTLVDGMAPMNTHTMALNELMTLRNAENTSKGYVVSLKPSTPINVNLLASLLADYADRVFVDGLCFGLRDGFKIGYTEPPKPCASKNRKTAYLMSEIVDSTLLHEVKKGHTFGPFISPPLYNFQIYLIGLVPKKNSSKWRTIFRLWYPKSSDHSVNATTVHSFSTFASMTQSESF